MSVDVLALSVDALALSVDVLALSVEALALSIEALALSVDALALQSKMWGRFRRLMCCNCSLLGEACSFSYRLFEVLFLW
ncbi:hypothetical protein [Nostoc sp.]|uniref:hypothetical protein n=1 Tax=Nostoc sp. TaxID=1180 RepID=UPI002FFC44E3